MTYRQRGQRIEVRFLLTSEPFLVMPVTVVADGPDLISHYLADGTPYLRREALDGSPPPRVIPPQEIDTVATRMVEAPGAAPTAWSSPARARRTLSSSSGTLHGSSGSGT